MVVRQHLCALTYVLIVHGCVGEGKMLEECQNFNACVLSLLLPSNCARDGSTQRKSQHCAPLVEGNKSKPSQRAHLFCEHHGRQALLER